MDEIILAYQGEMALKGLNRATFESILLKTMRRRLRSLGEFRVYKAQSTMYALSLIHIFGAWLIRGPVQPADDYTAYILSLIHICRWR